MSAPVCYLTRALIGPRTVFERGLHDPYTWHQLVWKAFPGRDGATRDYLTRLDDKPEGTRLLIVSPASPTRPAWLGDADEWASKVIREQFFQARRYRFQLRANPTIKRVIRDAEGKRKKNGKREAIVDPEELHAWLARKGEDGGFRLSDGATLETFAERSPFTKKSKTCTLMTGTHGAVSFRGMLEVTDPVVFRTRAFLKGVGSAKAFGFGLLVLAPDS